MTVLQKYNQTTGRWEILQAGVAGATGPANKLTIGTVTTVTNGTPASATITGTQPNQVLNLTLPKGDAGGWVTAALLADGTDLNTVTTPGTYRIAMGGTVALNHPGNGLSGALEVVAAGATRILQRFTIQTNDLVAIRNLVDTTWSPWATVPLKGSIGSGDLTGTGSPLGVISAPVGTYYTDTAGTNGAWRWLKKSGTGNTGWDVVIGDTGDRELKTTIINGWAVGSIRIRRVGNLVSLMVTNLGGAGKTSTSFLPVPSGFHVAPVGAYDTNIGFLYDGSLGANARAMPLKQSSSTFDLVDSLSGMQWGLGRVTYMTGSPWPTTLPGTPA